MYPSNHSQDWSPVHQDTLIINLDILIGINVSNQPDDMFLGCGSKLKYLEKSTPTYKEPPGTMNESSRFSVCLQFSLHFPT